MKISTALNTLFVALAGYVQDCAGEDSPESKSIQKAWETVKGEVEGKEGWAETHYMIVEAMVRSEDMGFHNRVARVEDGEEGQSSGMGALWEFAYKLTNKFHSQYKDYEGDDFHDIFADFMHNELK